MGLDPNSSRSDCLSLLSSQCIDCLLNLRTALFSECHSASLLHDGDELVSRKSTRKGKSLSVKLAEDVCSLVHSLTNQLNVPRSLLKNRKRDKSYFESSRSSNLELSQPHSNNAPSLSHVSPATGTDTISNLQYQSVHRGIVKDINSLKDEVKALKKDLLALNRSKMPSPSMNSCFICVICSDPHTEATAISTLLNCPILSLSKVNRVFKVKIPEACLRKALSSAHPGSHSVFLWKNKCTPDLPNPPPDSQKTLCPEMSHKMSLLTFNCRGFKSSVDYLRHLTNSDIDVIVLQEHWLWPFEVDVLSSVNPDFAFTAVTDNRLNDTSDLVRGCGGVAILWRKSLNASPLLLHSDRMCGLSIDL